MVVEMCFILSTWLPPQHVVSRVTVFNQSDINHNDGHSQSPFSWCLTYAVFGHTSPLCMSPLWRNARASSRHTTYEEFHNSSYNYSFKTL